MWYPSLVTLFTFVNLHISYALGFRSLYLWNSPFQEQVRHYITFSFFHFPPKKCVLGAIFLGPFSTDQHITNCNTYSEIHVFLLSDFLTVCAILYCFKNYAIVSCNFCVKSIFFDDSLTSTAKVIKIYYP